MASAKDKMKDYLLDHVGEDVPRETLRDVAGGIQDWQRALRTLRQETGLDIVATRTGYILTISSNMLFSKEITAPVSVVVLIYTTLLTLSLLSITRFLSSLAVILPLTIFGLYAVIVTAVSRRSSLIQRQRKSKKS